MANEGPWGGSPKDDAGKDGGRGKNGKTPPPDKPWGTGAPGPQRPVKPGVKAPPEIDDLMRKGQERLRVIMGGRGPGGGQPPQRGNGPFGGVPPRNVAIGVGLAALLLWASASFYRVQTNEQSVEFLFGDAIDVGTEGLNFAPWPFVTHEVVDVSGERVVEIGVGADNLDSGLMLTGDQNIVDMEYQIVWNVADPEKFLFSLGDPRNTIRAVAESAMRDIIARTELAPILNRDRGAIGADLHESIQSTLDAYQAGINVLRVNMDRADPPSEVIDAFRDVQAAQQERDRLTKEADAYANRVLAEARGEAAALVEQAEAYRAQAVNGAEGEAARFNSVYDEYVKAPEVTRRRMYLETMEQVLGSVDKVIIDSSVGGDSGVVPYLPLGQLRSGNEGTN